MLRIRLRLQPTLLKILTTAPASHLPVPPQPPSTSPYPAVVVAPAVSWVPSHPTAGAQSQGRRSRRRIEEVVFWWRDASVNFLWVNFILFFPPVLVTRCAAKWEGLSIQVSGLLSLSPASTDFHNPASTNLPKIEFFAAMSSTFWPNGQVKRPTKRTGQETHCPFFVSKIFPRIFLSRDFYSFSYFSPDFWAFAQG